MIKVYKESDKITPNELAKFAIADRLETVIYFLESYEDLDKGMTNNERDAYFKAVDKQIARIRKLLGVSKIERKVLNSSMYTFK